MKTISIDDTIKTIKNDDEQTSNQICATHERGNNSTDITYSLGTAKDNHTGDYSKDNSCDNRRNLELIEQCGCNCVGVNNTAYDKRKRDNKD